MRYFLTFIILMIGSIALHAQSVSALRSVVQHAASAKLSHSVAHRVFTASHGAFQGPQTLLTQVPYSVAQISRPSHKTVLGTGFVLKDSGQVWIAMPYHVGGPAGGQRTARLKTRKGTILEVPVTITVNGTAGWHAMDLSLAPLPPDVASQVTGLEIAEPDLSQPAYSVGYITGKFTMDDFLPLERTLLTVEGTGLMSQFLLPSSIHINGYCGAPLVQAQGGVWKAVGMHNGSCLDKKNPPFSRGGAVYLKRVVPELVEQYAAADTSLGLRGLYFRGWPVTRLELLERVDRITLVSPHLQEPIVRHIRNYPNPYLDSHTEQALDDLPLSKGDQLLFTIVRQKHGSSARSERTVTFTIP